MDLPPRPPPDSEQPPPLRTRLPKGGFAVRGVAASIDELRATLALADKHGLSSEEKRKLKKKVCGWFRDWPGVWYSFLWAVVSLGVDTFSPSVEPDQCVSHPCSNITPGAVARV